MFPGNGYKIANDVLTDISYVLVEPVCNTGLGTTVFVNAGPVTCTPGSMTAIYVGAMLICDVSPLQEIITVLAVTATTFTANFVTAHQATALLYGATFPVGQPLNPFFTQTEMLSYISNAENNYLTEVKLIYERGTQLFVSGQTVATQPSDCIQIERIAVNGESLYEQSQVALDLLDYRWVGEDFAQPETWFQDRVNFQTYGIRPVPSNQFTASLIYSQREAQRLALNEGFLLPDPFLTYVKYGALAWCFDKDGEMRDAARAKYCQQRFEMGVKIGTKYLENIEAQTPTGGM